MPDFPAKQRQKLADEGQAMPHGGFPIRNRADLQRAIKAIGRAKNPTATKAWIKKRAKELNAMDLIPEAWTVSHSEKPSLDELVHHGVKGMKWGVRRTAEVAGIGLLAVGGAAVAVAVLSKGGHIPVSSIGSRVTMPKTNLIPPGTPMAVGRTAQRATTSAGERAARQLARSQRYWKADVKTVLDDMAQANAEQDTWMRSIGLGHIVNNAKG